jgi:hypothetical protein
MGLIFSGSLLHQRLARPNLRKPEAEEIFDALLGPRGLRTVPSPAGLHLGSALSLWGGLDQFAEALSSPISSRLLQAYLAREDKKREREPGFLAFPGKLRNRRRFLTFEDIRIATGGEGEVVRQLIDRYLARGILRPGFYLHCKKCQSQGWYPLETVGRTFRCSRCSEESLLTEPSWRTPRDGPQVYYDLSEVVFQAVRNNCHAPVLALLRLRQGTRSFLFTTEREILEKDGTKLMEIDLVVIADGQIIVGEAKTTEFLKKGAGEEKKAFSKLVALAKSATADQLVLATTAAQWIPRTVAMAEARSRNERARFRKIEGLGAPS